MSRASSRPPLPRRRRRLIGLLVVIAGVSLVLGGWFLARAWRDGPLPLPQVVGDTVPVVHDGRAVNFTVLGKIAGDGQADLVSDLETVRAEAGPVLRAQVDLDGAASSWGGWMFTHGYFDHPQATGQLDWGAHPRSGYDLSGATALTIVARGSRGGEMVELFTAGQGYNPNSGLVEAAWPDSANKILQFVTLTDQFVVYTFPLSGADLSYIGNGFGFAVAADRNPDIDTVVIDLAAVHFELPDAAERVQASQQAAQADRRFDLGAGTATVLAALISGVTAIIVARLKRPEST